MLVLGCGVGFSGFGQEVMVAVACGSDAGGRSRSGSSGMGAGGIGAVFHVKVVSCLSYS